MSWETPVPLDPWVLPQLDAARYAEVRAAWFRFTGSPRRDDAVPFPAAPVDTARKITGIRPAFNKPQGIAAWGELFLFDDPASDAYAPGLRTVLVRYRTVTTQNATAGRDARGRIVLGTVTTQTDEPEPGQTLIVPVPDMASLRTGYQTSYNPAGPPSHYPAGWPKAAWVGSHAVERGTLPGMALETPAVSAPQSWLGAPDFVPPSVPVSFGGLGIARRIQLSPDDYVWMRDPHPWIPPDRMPPGTRGGKVLSLFGPDRFEIVSLRRVRAGDLPGGPFVAWVDNERHVLRRDANGVWEGSYRHHESGNVLSQLENAGGPFGAVYRTLNRTGAIEVLFTVAAAAVTLGAGAGFAQAALAGASGAAGAGAGSLAPGIAAGAASATVGAVAAPSVGPGGPFGAALEAAKANQALIERGVLYNPDTGDPVLIEASKASLWVQGLDGIWGAMLRSFTAGALTPAKRAEFRIAMVELRARIATMGGGAIAIAGAVAQVARTLVLALGTGGLAPAVEAGLELAQASVSQATQILNELELQRALASLEASARLDALRQIDQLIATVLADTPA